MATFFQKNISHNLLKITSIILIVLSIFCVRNALATEFSCEPSPFRRMPSFLHGIDKIILAVDVYPPYFRAIGDECSVDADCNDDGFEWPFNSAGDKSNNLKYQKISKTYSPVLYRENIKKIFYERLRYRFGSFVLGHVNECEVPGYVVTDLNGLRKTSFMKAGTLTIHVKLSVNDTSNPAAAALSVSFYRPDVDAASYWGGIASSEIDAMPLNLPDDQIQKRIESFASEVINVQFFPKE